MLVEVKPAVTRADYQKPVPKLEAGLEDHWDHDILVVGADPRPGCFDGVNIAGYLGERYPGGWAWGPGEWMRCRDCAAAGIFHTDQTYSGRPCGCYDGDHFVMPLPRAHLEAEWAEATNDVKWRGVAA